jgi:hypothetical protein
MRYADDGCSEISCGFTLSQTKGEEKRRAMEISTALIIINNNSSKERGNGTSPEKLIVTKELTRIGNRRRRKT